MFRSIFLLLLFPVLLVNCSGIRPKNTSTIPLPFESSSKLSLSRDDAALRSKQIGSVSYILWLGLAATPNEYEGRNVINFELKESGLSLSSELLLDYYKGKIRGLSINGAQLPEEKISQYYNSANIRIPISQLKIGSNRIEVAFSQAFTNSAPAFNKLENVAEGETFLFSTVGPFRTNRMFPCFDQPDLKAPFELTVEAPEDWEIVSTTKEREVVKVNSFQSWSFPPTPAISTHQFSVLAGPFETAENEVNGIPVRVFTRKTNKRAAEIIFKNTESRIDFFSAHLEAPYPFQKLDFVAIPGINHTNFSAGTVLFDEVYLNEKTPKGLKMLIAKQLAHSWFGASVGFRWWNGMWLTDGLSTFLAHWSLADFNEDFFSAIKTPAISNDANSALAIDFPVPNTEIAQDNIESPLRFKAAAVIKQLYFTLGEDEFQEVLNRYLHRFSYRTSAIVDLLNVATESSGRNMVSWGRHWLQTGGIDEIKTEWKCDADKKEILQLKVIIDGQVPRLHKLKIALFYKSKRGEQGLEPKEFFEISGIAGKSSETNIEDGIGHKCPDFVFPNFGDFDFAKFTLDPASETIAKANLQKISDKLTRAMTAHYFSLDPTTLGNGQSP